MIGRIGEDQVVRLTDLLEKFEGVHPVDLGPALKAAGREILFENVGHGPIRLDEIDPGRAAAQGLDPDRARSGEKIQHPCVHDTVSENREQRLLDLVRSRTCLHPAWTLQPPPLRLSRNHAHKTIMDDGGWGRQARGPVALNQLTSFGGCRSMKTEEQAHAKGFGHDG